MNSFGIVIVSYSPLRRSNSDASEMVSQLLFGESVEISSIENAWAHIKCLADSYEGYMDSKHLILLNTTEMQQWNALPKTRMWNKENTLTATQANIRATVYRGSIIPNASTFYIGNIQFELLELPEKANTHLPAEELASTYLGTPYLWGGRGMHGIDCSGFTQQIAAFKGVSLLRDASQQVNQGVEVDFLDRKAGDLAFFESDKGKIIHVGILKSKTRILHASGWVREDDIDEEGIYRTDIGKYTHKFRTLRRLF